MGSWDSIGNCDPSQNWKRDLRDVSSEYYGHGEYGRMIQRTIFSILDTIEERERKASLTGSG